VFSDTGTFTRSDPRGSRGCFGGDKCKVSLHGIAVVDVIAFFTVFIMSESRRPCPANPFLAFSKVSHICCRVTH